MAYGMENNPPPLSIVSTVKLNQAGFTELVDTEMMFRRFLKRSRNGNLYRQENGRPDKSDGPGRALNR
jgi:hypothetical protein